MDKEMMAKVNEFMKANGRRELNMEEADQVVGGKALPGPEKNTVLIDGVVVDCYDFNTAYQAIVSQFGFFVALEVFRRSTGFECTETRSTYNWPGNYSDRDRMDVVLQQFWKIMNGEKSFG